MARYAIAIKDYDEHGNSATVYWYTRAGDTDNYSCDVADATTFSDKGAARCLMRALNLDEDEHFVEEVWTVERRTEKTIRLSDVVGVIEQMREKERAYCGDFCKLNSGKASSQRRRDCTLICAVLNSVLYELGALNY